MVSYFDVAENDYLFLKEDYEEGRVGNLICHSAQSICERYLKHVIAGRVTDAAILQTHSIRALRNCVRSSVPNFECDWQKVLLCDGYHLCTIYPGDDYFTVTAREVKECWEAVEEVRKSVMRYEQGS